MFSRRHPYLFFLLTVSAIFAGTLIVMSLIFAVGFNVTKMGEKIGIIEISGPILNSDKILTNIKKFREDKSIKAIILRINSPGGGVAPAQEILREIKKTTQTKKIIASMGSVAASGGYYIACGTDGIMASPGSITGSIGVIMTYTNVEALFKKIGLTPIVIKSGEFKDTGSPSRKMTENEKKYLNQFILGIHKQFVKAIADNRDIPVEKVESFADGRIFSGENAVDLGLVDRIGNFQDAIDWAGELCGIEGPITTVYAKTNEFSLIKFLLGETTALALEQMFTPQVYLTNSKI